ncbi:MAG TPA: peptidoglycan bridge formation glycyltransferase FemA/FemB family protein [Candidatus Woesebacteria bacterium]|nr:peptidoglycan bridge formation glycyltransferase FemA/FemB family protein [Candidatus Woesebacteria bacterium]
MIIREILPTEKDLYNSVVTHPIQTWEWGEFQIGEGHQIVRLGVFDKDKIISAYTVSFHQIPKIGYSVGTILRGPKINQEMLSAVAKIAKDHRAIFVKFEPDECRQYQNPLESLNYQSLVVSPKVAFYPYSYVVDLTKTETELLSLMHPKTRYNIRVANRYNVKVEHRTDDQAFEIYLKILFDTTKRQGFYLHSQNYHRRQWEILKKTGMAHIFLASYQDQVLSAFEVFTLKDRLFYPYGASLDINRQVMAPTLLMWEVIKFGKSLGLKTFDMWGSLGPDAKETDNGYGFSRFKQGYGGQLMKFVGTYDLVINSQLYKLYNLIDLCRWKLLRLKAKILR